MNCVFMPTRSAMVLPERVDVRALPAAITWEGSNEVRLWFDYLPGRVLLQWRPSLDGGSSANTTGAVFLAPSVVAKYGVLAVRLLCRHGELRCPS